MRTSRLAALGLAAALAGCVSGGMDAPKPRELLFVGVDLSGSFMEGGSFEDSLDFLARYLYARLNGLGGLEVPHSLFVGPIGGHSASEPRTFFPMQSFQGKDIAGIRKALVESLGSLRKEPYTDYNAFLAQVGDILRNRNLVLKPVVVVMVTDGRVDMPGAAKKTGYQAIDLRPLERMSRNVSLRLLFTAADAGQAWRDKVPRRRVKVWTQDAAVMSLWKDPQIFKPDQPMESQEGFFSWIRENVDFGVRARRVS